MPVTGLQNTTNREPYGSRNTGTCAQLTTAERAARRVARPAAIRVRAGGEQFTIEDRLAGRVTGTVDDFVLFRNDGAPAYNLAVVVDDGLQGVDQVCRGVDLLDSAPRQAWLANRLGFTVPEYLHVGLAINQRGGRLAKRDQPTDLDVDVALGKDAQDHFRLGVVFNIALPGMDKAAAEALVAKAHKIYPYSRATRGNIDVTFHINV